MSYLAALIERERGETPPLRPLLPARFEPDGPGPLEVVVEREAAVRASADEAPLPAARPSEPIRAIPAPAGATPVQPELPASRHEPREQRASQPIRADEAPPQQRPERVAAPTPAAEARPKAVEVRRSRVESPRPAAEPAVAPRGPAAERVTDTEVVLVEATARERADLPNVRGMSEPVAPRATVRMRGLAPAPAPRTEPAQPPGREERAVRVSIGRVELRQPAARAAVPAPPPAPRRPRLSLEDYLRERSR